MDEPINFSSEGDSFSSGEGIHSDETAAIENEN